MRIVIKIGTSTLAYETGLLNIRRVEELCRVMSDLKNAGNEVILISSGAIGMKKHDNNLCKIAVPPDNSHIPLRKDMCSLQAGL